MDQSILTLLVRKESVLITGKNTDVSGPAEEAFDRIIRRPDLGPPDP